MKEKWRPCSEGLPKDHDMVWVTLDYREINLPPDEYYVCLAIYEDEQFICVSDFDEISPVTAWMPLAEPEPYEGEK
jgi:hypothetical protein